MSFYRGGIWKQVVVDDFFPVKTSGWGASNYRYVFGHSQDTHEVWVQVLEKAYAKLNGSYAAIEGGLVSEGLVNLTGGMGDVIRLKASREDGTLFDGT